MSGIVIVGSINMDVINQVKKHPVPGETIKGYGTQYSAGGKGANQAVAAAMAGGNVTMLGGVGTDSFGPVLVSTLNGYGVNTGSVIVKEGTSGLAFITVDESGENCIILSAGSNGKITVEDIREQLALLQKAKAVLLQNEIPWEVTRFVMEEARKRGVKVYFNPAPAMQVPADALQHIDMLILNETEAEIVSGISAEKYEEAARKLISDGVGAVIVTLGEKGSFYADARGASRFTPAFKVNPVDTTAAGDTFIGAYAQACESGKPVEECLRFASAAAALAVTRHGAQASIPSEAEINAFLRSLS